MDVNTFQLRHMINKLKEQNEKCWIVEGKDKFDVYGSSLRSAARVIIEKTHSLYDYLDLFQVAPTVTKPELESLTEFLKYTNITIIDNNDSNSANNLGTNMPIDICISTTKNPDNPHYKELTESVIPKKVYSIEKVFPEKPFLLVKSTGIVEAKKSELNEHMTAYGIHLLALDEYSRIKKAEQMDVMSTYKDEENLKWNKWYDESCQTIQRCFPFCNVTIYDENGNPLKLDRYDKRGFSVEAKALLRTTETISNEVSKNIKSLHKSMRALEAAIKDPMIMHADAYSNLANKVLDELDHHNLL